MADEKCDAVMARIVKYAKGTHNAPKNAGVNLNAM